LVYRSAVYLDYATTTVVPPPIKALLEIEGLGMRESPRGIERRPLSHIALYPVKAMVQLTIPSIDAVDSFLLEKFAFKLHFLLPELGNLVSKNHNLLLTGNLHLVLDNSRFAQFNLAGLAIQSMDNSSSINRVLSFNLASSASNFFGDIRDSHIFNRIADRGTTAVMPAMTPSPMATLRHKRGQESSMTFTLPMTPTPKNSKNKNDENGKDKQPIATCTPPTATPAPAADDIFIDVNAH